MTQKSNTARARVQVILRENAMSLGDLTEPVIAAFDQALDEAEDRGRQLAVDEIQVWLSCYGETVKVDGLLNMLDYMRQPQGRRTQSEAK